jgi:glycosyltransferase involved in cell wall biosynthesis
MNHPRELSLQDKIKALIASLAKESSENKLKGPTKKSIPHQDLDLSFLNPWISNEEESRWVNVHRKTAKLFSTVLRVLKRKIFKKARLNIANIKKFDLPENCVIAVPHLSSNDAVCNDAFLMRSSLRKFGINSHIYAYTWDKGLGNEVIGKSKVLSLLQSSGTLLLYNHCVYWPSGMEFIASACGPVWFRYHNVTPAEYFAPYDPISTFSTQMGRKQTEEILKIFGSKISRYVPVSPFNSEELRELRASDELLKVLPPFHKLDEFAQCRLNEDLKTELRDGKVNILFVGRVAPNKGFEKLLLTVQRYVQFYGHQVRLIFAGSLTRNFTKYYEHLLSLINAYRLSSIVRWTGKLNFDDLHTYYACSDLFLCLSEHEGFCIPILEAQVHKLPIIAVDRAAIGDTIGRDQLCFSDFDPELLATAIHRIVQDSELKKDLVEAGLRNVDLREQREARHAL